MTWTGRQRLEALATYLETTDFAPGKFHMSMWMAPYGCLLNYMDHTNPSYKVLTDLYQRSDKDAPAFEYNEHGEYVPIDCRTAGCAVGWGITGIPEFRRQGLHFTEDRTIPRVAYAGLEEFGAVMAFFGLYLRDANWLFSPTAYAFEARSDPKYVAARIRRHLSEKSDST